ANKINHLFQAGSAGVQHLSNKRLWTAMDGMQILDSAKCVRMVRAPPRFGRQDLLSNRICSSLPDLSGADPTDTFDLAVCMGDGESVLRFRIPLRPPVASHQTFSAGSPAREKLQ